MGSYSDRARDEFASADQALRDIAEQIENAPEDISDEDLSTLEAEFAAAKQHRDEAEAKYQKAEEFRAAREAEKLAIPDTKDAVEFKSIESQRDPLTYRKDNAHEVRFFADAARAALGDSEAQERQARHRRETYDISTTSGGGGELVVPIYLQEAWAAYARAGRPWLSYLGVRDLPGGGNSITIPTQSGGVAVAVQSSENSNIQETDLTTSSVVANVTTIAGLQDVSIQLLDRSDPGIDQIVFGDLARAYNAKFETDAINGNSTNYKGILNVSSTNTFSITTTTVSSLYSKILGGVSDVESNFYQTPDHILMHPRRWNFMLAASAASSNWPVVVPVSPENTGGAAGAPNAQGFVGQLAGIPVIVSSNVPTNLGTGTNEDRVVIGCGPQFYAWEAGQPKLGVFPDVGSGALTVRFRLHNYVAFQFGRYSKSITIGSGSGLATPSF